jgi:hypothetical protein
MTQDEIIEMARQAGLVDADFEPSQWCIHEYMTFAKLVAAKKQEDIIKVIESLGTWAHIDEVVNTIRGLK